METPCDPLLLEAGDATQTMSRQSKLKTHLLSTLTHVDRFTHHSIRLVLSLLAKSGDANIVSTHAGNILGWLAPVRDASSKVTSASLREAMLEFMFTSALLS